MEDFSYANLICQETQPLLDAHDGDGDQIGIEHEHIDEYIEILVSKETSFETKRCNVLLSSWFKRARSDSIKWIMKTRAYFNFSHQIAYLAVTYYDRFLMRRRLEKDKSWVFRLLSIASLSLAAKMEEGVVPPLSEYESEEHIFDSNTIQRMELLILSTLEWRMNSVTPFAYLSYFKSKLQLGNEPRDFASKSVGFIFGIIDDINLVDHRSSTIAAAAVLAASDHQRLNKQVVESKLSIFSSCAALELDHVFSCYAMMTEESRNCPSAGDNNTSFITRSNKRRRLEMDNIHEKKSP
ncbi:uncharacterized protein A4U43_C07F29650 [Asparagus officinalis]|uniref:Cyclin-like domain-containing protein n=1 Tax=Asparagus officinalis TaxID=4686 RepID=A0A5P1EFY1_ASPOF|nr:cyclin-D5-2-like [Asparagus officinalis]ONK64762.1 uncharacterized protein A4U43_C07F29650 [Asparagus officinalis]